MIDVLEFCGFNTAFDMIKTHFTQDELMDLLSDLLHENKEISMEIVEEIASEHYEWVDYDTVKADFEDMKYQEYKDRGLDE